VWERRLGTLLTLLFVFFFRDTLELGLESKLRVGEVPGNVTNAPFRFFSLETFLDLAGPGFKVGK
jgi:hypothetical protein